MKRRIIEHPYYVQPLNQICAAMDDYRPGHMIFLVGPSGVGKTTMRHAALRRVLGRPDCWGAGRVPIIESYVTMPQKAYFSSRDLASALVAQLKVPRMEWLLNSSDLDEETSRGIDANLRECEQAWSHAHSGRRPTEGESWAVFVRLLRARNCKFVSLDQVTALLVNHRDKSPADHITHLMAIAEDAGVMFLMTGVHTAVRLWEVHSELRRRVRVVWVPPYSDRRKEDMHCFLRLLETLSLRYECRPANLMVDMAFDLLAATAGVLGELLELLAKAKRVALENGDGIIRRKTIEACFYNERDLASLWKDVNSFEEVMMPGDIRKRAELVQRRWSMSESTTVTISD
jgi:ABC-type cobalamin/Fe3+-siderophores transport system ATPase subunit